VKLVWVLMLMLMMVLMVVSVREVVFMGVVFMMVMVHVPLTAQHHLALPMMTGSSLSSPQRPPLLLQEHISAPQSNHRPLDVGSPGVPVPVKPMGVYFHGRPCGGLGGGQSGIALVGVGGVVRDHPDRQRGTVPEPVGTVDLLPVGSTEEFVLGLDHVAACLGGLCGFHYRQLDVCAPIAVFPGGTVTRLAVAPEPPSTVLLLCTRDKVTAHTRRRRANG